MFLICYLDPRCAGKILPVFGNGAKALIQLIGGAQGHRVYDPEGVACTQTAGGGGLGGKTGLYLLPPDAPLILDDALLTFDRGRTRAALELLRRLKRQVLLFTCRQLEESQ